MIKIGFIGLGVMGYWMVKHLLKKYNGILVYNRSKKNILKLRKSSSSNFVTTNNLQKIANECNFIFSCVGNDKDLKQIYFSKNGIFNSIKNNTFIIDHTTSSSDFAVYANTRFLEKKSFFFDAPVSGGEIGSMNGSLSIMIGGESKKLKFITPLMKCYSKKITFMGRAGSGQLTKMVNQICVSGVIQSLSEGLIFAKKNNLDFNKLILAIASGAAQSWQMNNRSKTMWNNKFNFGFMNKHMYKDLKIVEKVASEKKINIPVTKKILKFYKILLTNGFEHEDTSSLIKLLN